MKIHAQKEALLPRDFRFSGVEERHDEELERHLERLNRAIEEGFRKIYRDVVGGTTKFQIIDHQPALSDLLEGQMVMWDDTLYLRMDNKLMFARFSLVNYTNLVCRITKTS